MEVKEKITFSKNWNNKLLCTCFTTIRPQSKKYDVGDVVDIRIEERFFCYATIISKRVLTLQQVISEGYHFTDTGLHEKEFIELMSTMYSKKSWWKNYNTEMQIVFLEKIVQLNLFEPI